MQKPVTDHCPIPVQKCAMCEDDPVAVTMRPCGHRFCVGKLHTRDLMQLYSWGHDKLHVFG